MEQFIYFILGAVGFWFISKVIGYIHVINVISGINTSCLMLLRENNNNALDFNTAFIKTLEAAGVDEKEIDFQRKMLEERVLIWQEMSIRLFHVYYPPRIAKMTVPFVNWREAMNYLDKIEKNLVERKK